MSRVEWREIPYAPWYEVSSGGFVRNKRTSKCLRAYLKPKGYLEVTLCGDSGLICRKAVHHLVLEIFGSPRPSRLAETRHLNGNKQDNREENLKWGTQSENRADQIAHGRCITKSAEAHSSAKLKLSDVLRIREMALFGAARADIARAFSMNASVISRIVNRRLWRGAHQS